MSDAPRILDDAHAAALLPERDPRGHKGTFGRLSVVAGSLDYAGAALLAGTAALRTGCGLVVLFVPASLQPHIAGRVPELITRGLPEAEPGAGPSDAAADAVLSETHDALVIGPGLRVGPGTQGLVRSLLRAPGAPAVVDAGAFDVLAAWAGWPSLMRRACVLTPHAGEMRRLGRDPGQDDDERVGAAASAAAEWRQVVVLKGARTVIADPTGGVVRSPSEVPALGTAGSGDVLAGVIGSLLAQGMAPAAAAALGVHLHVRAGLDISAELGDAGLLASDLLDALPRARRVLDERRRSAGRSPDRRSTGRSPGSGAGP